MPLQLLQTRRPGLTLIEVLLSLTLLGIGLLALATTGATLIAHSSAAAAALRSGSRLRAVLDSLRATPCAALRSGADSTGGARVAWLVSGAGSSRHLASTLAAQSGRRPITLASETDLPCD